MRLATNLNHGGGHVYAFAGGWHKHGDWCTSYEYQPVIGYCGTHTRCVMRPGAGKGVCANSIQLRKKACASSIQLRKRPVRVPSS